LAVRRALSCALALTGVFGCRGVGLVRGGSLSCRPVLSPVCFPPHLCASVIVVPPLVWDPPVVVYPRDSLGPCGLSSPVIVGAPGEFVWPPSRGPGWWSLCLSSRKRFSRVWGGLWRIFSPPHVGGPEALT